jgi:glycosyltransferase involved in cell wall biosynthesis
MQADIRLIYANGLASAKILEFLSFLTCPVICHVHELEGVIRVLGTEYLGLVQKKASEYIATSHAVKSNLVEGHGIPADKIHVIHGFIPAPEHGVELEGSTIRETIQKELKIPAGAKIVCACGSIETRKGTDLFLRVAARIVRGRTPCPVHFVWIGGRPEKVRDMLKEVAFLALQDVVHFTGEKSDVMPYLIASDIFLLTSREDPFPLVMMEAALCRNPIICFGESGGAPEFVEQDAGFVVSDFDVIEMSDKIIALISSTSLRNQMGMSAKQKVLSRHGLNLGASKITAIIEEALGVRRASLSAEG